MPRLLPLLAVLAVFIGACAAGPRTPPSADPPPGDAFWRALTVLCGKAFEGRMIEGTAPGDAAFGGQRMVMHVRECDAQRIKIPFHVGENRSRTWVITRLPEGHLRLKHDHRHADGSEEDLTQYGGDTRVASTGAHQEFHADALTARMLPAAATNIWTLAISPDGKAFTYGLRREAENRRFRVDFDLTRPVPAPPPPWGHQ